MLMVIFGAGASYDSAEACWPISKKLGDSPDRLPLADHLFDNRPEFAKDMQRFPDCLPIITFLRKRGEASVESVLEQLQAKSGNHDQGYREMVAIRYYLQWMIWSCELRWEQVHNGVTNYGALLYLIRQHREGREPTCFVTFNYDTMLEKAVPALGGKIEQIQDYINSDSYKIFKVHGSVNWGRTIQEAAPLSQIHSSSPEEIAKQVIRHAPFIVGDDLVNKQYEMIHSLSKREASSPALFPAIAIPVETKLDFELPFGHWEMLSQCIAKIHKLLVIGWHAADTHFLDVLSKHLPPDVNVHVVCGNSTEGKQVLAKMQNAGLKLTPVGIEDVGFTGFILKGSAEKFLKS
jgi:hypothetical protein